MQTDEIIERLKSALGAKSDLALAKRLKIPQGTLAEWRTRGRITPGGVARIAVAIGRSVDWVLTGQPSHLEAATRVAEEAALYGALPKVLEETDRVRAMASAIERFPVWDRGAVDLLSAIIDYIKDASPQERETVRRLVRSLRGGSKKVRRHLIGQLELIEELVEKQRPNMPGGSVEEGQDPPDCAAAG